MGKFLDDINKSNEALERGNDALKEQARQTNKIGRNYAGIATLLRTIAEQSAALAKPPPRPPTMGANGRITPFEKDGFQPTPPPMPGLSPPTIGVPPPSGPTAPRISTGGGGSAGADGGVSSGAGGGSSSSRVESGAGGWGKIISGGGSANNPWRLAPAMFPPKAGGKQGTLTGWYLLPAMPGYEVNAFGTLATMTVWDLNIGQARQEQWVMLPPDWQTASAKFEGRRSARSSGGSPGGLVPGQHFSPPMPTGPGIYDPTKPITGPGIMDPTILFGGKAAAGPTAGERVIAGGIQQVVNEIRQLRQDAAKDNGLPFRTGRI